MADAGGERVGFLARWSRRKGAAARAAATGETPLAVAGTSVLAAAAAPPARPPVAAPPDGAAVLGAANDVAVPVVPANGAEDGEPVATLPPVETLQADSDLAPFLRPGVPAGTRAAALRRAWVVDPTIAEFVGPSDYAWDYNAPGGVPGSALALVGDVGRLLAQAIGDGPRQDQSKPAPPEGADDFAGGAAEVVNQSSEPGAHGEAGEGLACASASPVATDSVAVSGEAAGEAGPLAAIGPVPSGGASPHAPLMPTGIAGTVSPSAANPDVAPWILRGSAPVPLPPASTHDHRHDPPRPPPLARSGWGQDGPNAAPAGTSAAPTSPKAARRHGAALPC